MQVRRKNQKRPEMCKWKAFLGSGKNNLPAAYAFIDSDQRISLEAWSAF